MPDEFSGNPWNDFAKTRDCLYTVKASRPGFHGDLQLLETVEVILNKSDVFFETGTYHGCTSYYVSKNFPHLICHSSEKDLKNLEIALDNCKDCSNLDLTMVSSPDCFKYTLEKNPEYKKLNSVFWLDAHGGDRNSGPVREEISFIINNFNNFAIFIDDVKIPNSPWFGDQFDIEWILEGSATQAYMAYVPSYKEKTGYALVGWLLLTNRDDLETDSLSFVKKIEID